MRRFPLLFGPDAKKPLKIGITNDLLEIYAGTATKRDVCRAVSFHISTRSYRRAVAAGGSRFDLEGRPSGEVSEAEQLQAREALEKTKRDRNAYFERSQLLKKVEASGLRPYAYAQREGLDYDKLIAAYDKGLHERSVRHAERSALVQDYLSSGLSPEEFAGERGLKLEKVQQAIQKVETGPGLRPNNEVPI